MECCCPNSNIITFKGEINQILGRLFSQYYNITFLAFLDSNGFIVDYQIHSLSQNEAKKKIDDILNKALEFKISSSKAAKLLGFDTCTDSFIRGDTHIVVNYEIQQYLLVIFIEMSKPLIDAFNFEKFNEKIELIIIELKKKIDNFKDNKVDNNN
jgi:hypothetical protein